MKTYLADIIPKIKGFSQKLDNLTMLTNQHWVVMDELQNSKIVYIFRSNFELLISQNGKVEKGKWEYLGNNSLLIERKEDSYLFRHGFFDSNILALKVDGTDEYAFLVNENNYGGDLNSIDRVLNFLETKYLGLIYQNNIGQSNIPEIEHATSKELTLDKELNVIRNDFGKYGYLDGQGNTVIGCEYDGAYDFSEESARVYITINDRDLYGFIDKHGSVIVSLMYEYAICFSEGLASVRLNGKFGYVDNKNKVVIGIQFDDARSFSKGVAKVKKGSEYYYINLQGQII
jgi:hypothetical protein